MNKTITFFTFLVFAVASSSGVIAAPASLPITGTSALGATSWTITNTGGTSSGSAFSGACVRTAGFTVEDATSADGSTDAYDFAHSIWVDGAIFVAPGTVDVTGNTVMAGPVTMSGLDVTMEYTFSDVVQAGRARAIFENPTNATIDISADMAMNSGASPFTIQATSSGDTVFDTADRWVVSSDGDPATDPVNTTVLWGDRAAATPSFATTTVFVCDGNEDDGIGVSFDISIPAGSRRQLLFFAGLGDIVGTGNTVAGAIANAAMFDVYFDIDPSLLEGIDNSELSEILNWELRPIKTGGGGPSCALGPNTASAWQAGDLWLLLALVSSLGLWRVRRRAGQSVFPCCRSAQRTCSRTISDG